MNALDALTPDALRLVEQVARHGSMAAAARSLGLVPSALTYRVRQLEDALDVLLFDRSSRQAKLTAAGEELLREGAHLLQRLGAVAERVKRVATGWEPQITIAVDGLVVKDVVLELCDAFYAQTPTPPTRIRLRDEVLSGTWEALVSGEADLALGVVVEAPGIAGVRSRPLGDVPFVFAVAPHHPLATAPEPLDDAAIASHRIVAVADSGRRGGALTVGILGGQDVLTVATMADKLSAQLRGIGCGFLPACVAGPYLATGRLVTRSTDRPPRVSRLSIAWRDAGRAPSGLALAWWLARMASPATRDALLDAGPRRRIPESAAPARSATVGRKPPRATRRPPAGTRS